MQCCPQLSHEEGWHWQRFIRLDTDFQISSSSFVVHFAAIPLLAFDIISG